MRRCIRLICLSIVACGAVSGSLAADDKERFAGIDSYISTALDRWQVPGLAIAVVKDDKVIFTRGYGYQEVGTDRAVTANTPFHIASCDKSFVATAIAILVDEGKLHWDDPVVKHLPEFELSDSYLTAHVTLRDLLCHRTGLRRADLLADGAGFDPKIVMRRLQYLEPIAELRTQRIYNNHMYTVLGEVVARVSGETSEQFIARRILQPLGMTSTTASVSNLDPENLARRHWRSDAGIVARAPDAGTHSTVKDMGEWLRLHLAEGTYAGQQLLKPQTVREMQALQFSSPIRSPPKNNTYAAQFLGSGLGWNVQDYRGRKMVSHAGAWGAMVAMMPEERLGVVVLSNLDLEYLCVLLSYDVFDAFLIGPEATWNPSKWEATWLKHEPPGAAYHPRDEAKTTLEAQRIADTSPSHPLKDYVGTYESKLYGRLVVRQAEDGLNVTFAGITTPLSHWEGESFYARAPTRLTFDWLLTFPTTKQSDVPSVTVQHVGWDKDEKDHVFVRAK